MSVINLVGNHSEAFPVSSEFTERKFVSRTKSRDFSNVYLRTWISLISFLYSKIDVWSFSLYTSTRDEWNRQSRFMSFARWKIIQTKVFASNKLTLLLYVCFAAETERLEKYRLLFYCRVFSRFVSLLLPQWSRNLNSDAPLSNGPC